MYFNTTIKALERGIESIESSSNFRQEVHQLVEQHRVRPELKASIEKIKESLDISVRQLEQTELNLADASATNKKLKEELDEITTNNKSFISSLCKRVIVVAGISTTWWLCVKKNST
jgi:hypothetical protein